MIELIFSLFANKGLNSYIAYTISYTSFVFILTTGSWLVYVIINRYLKGLINRLIANISSKISEKISKNRLIERFSYLAPGLLVYWVSEVFQVKDLYYSYHVSIFIQKTALVYISIQLLTVINSLLNIFEDVYGEFEISYKRPIRSYVQLVKIIIFVLIIIVTISIFINKSPIAILTGIGALTAVILLVFKDSILGFVASIQLSLNDMVRIGDWIDMPNFGASGDVIDISLNTVKVKNFDKTVTTIPTYALLTSGVKNWRGMTEAGGRRIKRSIYIDINSIKFCDDNMIDKYKKIAILKTYIERKLVDIDKENKKLSDSDSINQRKLTNVGTFRNYLVEYLNNHPMLRDDYTCLVRQLQPNENGLPIEIYAFTKVTEWNKYESIQADIFDHIFAILPDFELKVLQRYLQI
ncbi:MAG: mechanosensitive ion channel [Legionellales bacterium]|nr:mechanosensitive ion channel [Legionellales bacterium]